LEREANETHSRKNSGLVGRKSSRRKASGCETADNMLYRDATQCARIETDGNTYRTHKLRRTRKIRANHRRTDPKAQKEKAKITRGGVYAKTKGATKPASQGPIEREKPMNALPKKQPPGKKGQRRRATEIGASESQRDY
jgi:hypothetical protein